MEQFLQQLLNGIAWGSIYALIALGYTMVYGVLKLINFAHGEVYMVGAMAGYYTAHALGFAAQPSLVGLFAVLLISMAACGALGAVIERVAYRPLRNAPRLASLITAIGISLLLQNGGQLLFGADPKFFPSLVTAHEVLRVGSLAVSNIQLFVFGTAMFLMVGLEVVVMRTRFGRAMRAVSVDAQAAALMGVPVDRVISGTFVLGSALAAAAGILVGLSNPKIDPLMGLLPGLKAFVAAVLGGIGSIPGAMVGGLLLGVVETMVSAYLSSTYRDAIAFVILIAILLYRPTGLFGTGQVEKGMSSTARSAAALAAAIVVLVLADTLLPRVLNTYYLTILARILIAILAAVSLQLVNGFTGQFSIGHAGFMAVGAYTGAALSVYGSAPLLADLQQIFPAPVARALYFPIPLVFGGLAASLAGFLVGIPALRLRGDYLAIATLGFGEIIRIAILNIDAVGGARGFSLSAPQAGVDLRYESLGAIGGVVLVSVALIARLVYSSGGLAFRAVREDETAAEAMGIATTRVKVEAFAVASFFAGVAGALFAHSEGYVHTNSFSFVRSFEIMAFVVLGGLGSLSGAALAAAVLTAAPEFLRGFGEWRMVLYSLLIIGTMLVRPQGLLGSRELSLDWFRRRAAPAVER